MIPLTDLCVSRELAERMKSIGFEQSTQFYWIQEMEGYKWIDKWKLVDYSVEKRCFSAPTVGEIEMPETIDQKDEDSPYYWNMHRTDRGTDGVLGYQIRYGNAGHGDKTISIVAKTEAEAKGIMWCYLKENGFI